MLAPTASAPNRPSPLPALPLSDVSLGPVVMADDPCEAALSGADPTEPRKYYRARYYDPKLGRFLSEDPIMWKDSPSLYAYVKNSPVNFTDPSGEVPVKNNASRPIPFKPENEDGKVKLCMPGQTCDADGVYPPACDKYPVKVVDGCTAEVTPDGRLIISCPYFVAHPEKPDFKRHFPAAGQAMMGGPTNAQFHKDHPDWVPPNNKPNCGCSQ